MNWLVFCAPYNSQVKSPKKAMNAESTITTVVITIRCLVCCMGYLNLRPPARIRSRCSATVSLVIRDEEGCSATMGALFFLLNLFTNFFIITGWFRAAAFMNNLLQFVVYFTWMMDSIQVQISDIRLHYQGTKPQRGGSKTRNIITNILNLRYTHIYDALV